MFCTGLNKLHSLGHNVIGTLYALYSLISKAMYVSRQFSKIST